MEYDTLALCFVLLATGAILGVAARGREAVQERRLLRLQIDQAGLDGYRAGYSDGLRAAKTSTTGSDTDED